MTQIAQDTNKKLASLDKTIHQLAISIAKMEGGGAQEDDPRIAMSRKKIDNAVLKKDEERNEATRQLTNQLRSLVVAREGERKKGNDDTSYNKDIKEISKEIVELRQENKQTPVAIRNELLDSMKGAFKEAREEGKARSQAEMDSILGPIKDDIVDKMKIIWSPVVAGISKGWDLWRNKEDEEANKATVDNAKDMKEFTNKALHPGSIYTHDIHTEGLLKDIFNEQAKKFKQRPFRQGRDVEGYEGLNIKKPQQERIKSNSSLEEIIDNDAIRQEQLHRVITLLGMMADPQKPGGMFGFFKDGNSLAEKQHNRLIEIRDTLLTANKLQEKNVRQKDDAWNFKRLAQYLAPIAAIGGLVTYFSQDAIASGVSKGFEGSKDFLIGLFDPIIAGYKATSTSMYGVLDAFGKGEDRWGAIWETLTSPMMLWILSGGALGLLYSAISSITDQATDKSKTQQQIAGLFHKSIPLEEKTLNRLTEIRSILADGFNLDQKKYALLDTRRKGITKLMLGLVKFVGWMKMLALILPKMALGTGKAVGDRLTKGAISKFTDSIGDKLLSFGKGIQGTLAGVFNKKMLNNFTENMGNWRGYIDIFKEKFDKSIKKKKKVTEPKLSMLDNVELAVKYLKKISKHMIGDDTERKQLKHMVLMRKTTLQLAREEKARQAKRDKEARRKKLKEELKGEFKDVGTAFLGLLGLGLGAVLREWILPFEVIKSIAISLKGWTVAKLVKPFTQLKAMWDSFKNLDIIGKIKSIKIPDFIGNFYKSVTTKIGGFFSSVYGKIATKIQGWMGVIKEARWFKLVSGSRFITWFRMGFKLLGKPLAIIFAIFDFLKGYNETEGGVIEKIKGGIKAAIVGFFEPFFWLFGVITSWVGSLFGAKIDSGAIMKQFKDATSFLIDLVLSPWETVKKLLGRGKGEKPPPVEAVILPNAAATFNEALGYGMPLSHSTDYGMPLSHSTSPVEGIKNSTSTINNGKAKIGIDTKTASEKSATATDGLSKTTQQQIESSEKNTQSINNAVTSVNNTQINANNDNSGGNSHFAIRAPSHPENWGVMVNVLSQ